MLNYFTLKFNRVLQKSKGAMYLQVMIYPKKSFNDKNDIVPPTVYYKNGYIYSSIT